jgi:hypothetical protein
MEERTMTTNTQVIDRWLDVVEGRSTRLIGTRNSNTVFAIGNTVYSYGTHFPMAEHYGTQTDGFFVVNGDRYSPTTSGHQSNVRGAIGNRLHVIIPFSALDGAGIDRSSIEILDVTEDSWIEHKRSSADLADVPKHERERYVSLPCPRESGELCPQRDGTDGAYPRSYCSHGEVRPVEPEPDGLYHWTTGEHRLGAALFRARFARSRQGRMCRGPFTIPTGPETIYPTEACRHGMTRQHVMMVRETGRATFLSAFDQQETRAPYYLAQVTRSPESVAEAIEGLKPSAVRDAERDGVEVTRQGDVFAVSTTMTTNDLKAIGAKLYRRVWLTNPRGIDVSGPIVRTRDDLTKLRRIIALEDTNHQATEVAKVNGTTYAKGCLYHVPAGRAPDHARRRIGDGNTWSIIALNTVERSFGVARAWSARGYVD